MGSASNVSGLNVLVVRVVDILAHRQFLYLLLLVLPFVHFCHFFLVVFLSLAVTLLVLFLFSV